MQEIFCSGGCGPSLPALKESADAQASWAMDLRGRAVISNAGDKQFRISARAGGGDVPWFGVGSVVLSF